MLRWLLLQGLFGIADVGASHQVIEKTNNYIKQCQQVLSNTLGHMSKLQTRLAGLCQSRRHLKSLNAAREMGKDLRCSPFVTSS